MSQNRKIIVSFLFALTGGLYCVEAAELPNAIGTAVIISPDTDTRTHLPGHYEVTSANAAITGTDSADGAVVLEFAYLISPPTYLSSIAITDTGTLTVSGHISGTRGRLVLDSNGDNALDNNGTLTFASGGSLEVTGESYYYATKTRIRNQAGGTINFLDGSDYLDHADTYSSTNPSGTLDNHGKIVIGDMKEGGAKRLLEATALHAGGIIELDTQIDGFRLRRETTGGTVVLGKENIVFTDGITLAGASLDATAVNSTFRGAISGADTVSLGKTSDFYAAMNANALTLVNGTTTFHNSHSIASSVNLAAQAKLVAKEGATLGDYTTLYSNNGTIENSGSLRSAGVQNDGQVVNSGLLETNTLVNTGTITNTGTLKNGTASTYSFTNSGTINNSGTFGSGFWDGVNTGAIENSGTMEYSAKDSALSTGSLLNDVGGTLILNGLRYTSTIFDYTNNASSFVNKGTMSFDGGKDITFFNNRQMDNEGTFTTAGTMSNASAISNSGNMVLTGDLKNDSGATIGNTGELHLYHAPSRTGDVVFTNNGVIQNDGLLSFNLGADNGIGRLTYDAQYAGSGSIVNTNEIRVSASVENLSSLLGSINQTTENSSTTIYGAGYVHGYGYAYQLSADNFTLGDAVAGSKLVFSAMPDAASGITNDPWTHLDANVDAKNADIHFATEITRWIGGSLKTAGEVHVDRGATLWRDSEEKANGQNGVIEAPKVTVEGTFSAAAEVFGLTGHGVDITGGSLHLASGSTLHASTGSVINAMSPTSGYGFSIDPNATFAFDVSSTMLSYNGGDMENIFPGAALTLHGTMANGTIGSQNVALSGDHWNGIQDPLNHMDEFERLRLIAVDDAAYLADTMTGTVTWNGGTMFGNLKLAKSANGKMVILSSASGPGPDPSEDLTWTNDSGSSVWDVGLSQNWSGSAGGVAITRFLDGDSVWFTDTGAGAVRIVAADSNVVSVGSMLVENTVGNDYVFTGDAISGSEELRKKGDGALVFANDVSFSGGVSVETGSLGIGNGGTTGTLAADVSLAANTKLQFDRSDDLTHQGDILGSGLIEKNGQGTLVLTGTALEAAGALVSAGTLAVDTDRTLLISGEMRVRSGASLSLSASRNQALTAGTLVFESGSSLNITGVAGNAYGQSLVLATAGTALSGLPDYTIGGSSSADYLSATLNLENSGKSITAIVDLTWRDTHTDAGGQFDKAHGAFTVDDTFTLDASLADRSGTFVSGWDGKTLTKKGNGVLTLTAANSYSGDSEIEAGTLVLSGAGSLGDGTGKAILSTTQSTLSIAMDDDYALANNIEGAGNLHVDMTGGKTLALNKSNANFSGKTAIRSGTLRLLGAGTLGTSDVSIASGAMLSLSPSGASSFSNKLDGAGILEIAMAQSGDVLAITNANSGFAGNTSVKNGVLSLTGAGSVGSGAVAIARPGTLELANAGDTLFANAISGEGKVVMNSGDTVTLSGTVTHSGGTDVKQGTLILTDDASLGAGDVTVEAGGGVEIFNNKTYANTFSGSGSLTKNGTGTTVLSGDNASFSGDVYVIGGELTAAGISSLGAGNVLVANDGSALGVQVGAGDTAAALQALYDRSTVGGGTSYRTVFANGAPEINQVMNFGGGDDSDFIVDGLAKVGQGGGFDSGLSAFVIASTGTVEARGASTITAATATVDGTLVLNAGSVVNASGDVVFSAGSELVVVSDAINDIGKLKVDGAIGMTGDVVLTFGGRGINYVDQAFLYAEGGMDADTLQHLKNNVFNLKFNENGTEVLISGIKSATEIMKNILGDDGVSPNLAAGGNYTDATMDQFSDRLQDGLTNYLSLLDSDAITAPGQAFNAFRQLYGEYGVWARTPVIQATNSFWNQLNNRRDGAILDNAIAGATGTACSNCGNVIAACGSNHTGSRIWANAYGDRARQSSRDAVDGYRYRAGGVILGYDFTRSDNATFGFAAAYSRGDLKLHEESTKYDSDLLNLGLYFDYTHESNLFVKAGIGFTHGWNDYDVGLVVGGKKSGKYKAYAFSANIEAGYVWELPNQFNVIPSAGINYSYVKNRGWTESATGNGVANRFDSEHQSVVDIPLAVRVNKVWALGDGKYIAPEVRAAWIYTAGDREASIRSGYAGGPGYATLKGVTPNRSRWQIGAGIKAQLTERVEARLDYNYEFRSGYRKNELGIAIGVGF